MDRVWPCAALPQTHSWQFIKHAKNQVSACARFTICSVYLCQLVLFGQRCGLQPTLYLNTSARVWFFDFHHTVSLRFSPILEVGNCEILIQMNLYDRTLAMACSCS